ncbi:MAG: cbb3-type cytochrome c oxidase subunit I [Bacteroidetes bacterium]|nr:cbb3-type cytochrome c oxidase subunit I [Bacteroidota bacterium]
MALVNAATLPATESNQGLVDKWVVKAHFIAGITAFFVALLAGLVFSTQFLRSYLFPGIELLSPGRVRMVHTNMAAYGFLANLFFGMLYWAVPRLTGLRVWKRGVSLFLFWAWQAILLATFVGQLYGLAQGVEWAETPIFIDPVVVIGVLLMTVNFYVPIIKTKEKPLYVSLWYFTAAFVWTGLVYIMGNYLPQFFAPGVAGAAIGGLYIHDLVGLFVTPLGWGMMYYFVPLIMKKPIYSHALSLVGFWGLAFFYPLQGVHHFLWSPIPMFVQYGAVTSTIAVEIVVTTVVVNFFLTLRGSGSMLKTNLPLRWYYTGMVLYFTTCLQCAFQVTLTLQQVIHFTDWVVAHAHLVMLGVFGFWLLGTVTHLWPRVTGREWYSLRLNTWHYWLSTIGLVIMFGDLTIAGLVQGFSWRSLQIWEQSLIASFPFWLVRTFAGVLIVLGQMIWAYNLYRTAKNPIRFGESQKEFDREHELAPASYPRPAVVS